MNYLNDIKTVRDALFADRPSLAQEAFNRLEGLLKKYGVVEPTPGRRAYETWLKSGTGAVPTNSYWENIQQDQRDRWERIAGAVNEATVQRE